MGLEDLNWMRSRRQRDASETRTDEKRLAQEPPQLLGVRGDVQQFELYALH